MSSLFFLVTRATSFFGFGPKFWHVSCLSFRFFLVVNLTSVLVAIVKLLLDAGSKVDIVDKNKSTAFDLAAQHGKTQFFDLLVEHKAGTLTVYFTKKLRIFHESK